MLTIGLWAPASTAATFSISAAEQGTIVTLRGDITPNDPAALEALFNMPDLGRRIRAIRLDSAGGTLIGGIELARIVQRHAELSTMVVNGSTCASACFLVFAAGHQRLADYRSFIGVHGVADKYGNVTQETEAATRVMARVGTELGVPSAIIRRMIDTPPDAIAWLSPQDLMTMGTVMIGRPVQALRGGPRPTIPTPDAASAARTIVAAKARAALIERAAVAAAKADYVTAIRIWRELAEAGHGASQYNLGEMYYVGHGVPQDFTEAIKWYRLAAERGVSQAQFGLGVAYALGRGIHRDLIEADKWLSISMANEIAAMERAQIMKARAIVETQMTATQVAEADQKARAWTRPR